MFKRIRWMGIGAVAGIGVSAWAQVRLRRELDEHPALGAGARAARGLRDLRGALSEGREAMAEREAALRHELGARFGAGAPGHGPQRLRLVPPPDQEAAVWPDEAEADPDPDDRPHHPSEHPSAHPSGRPRRRRQRSS